MIAASPLRDLHLEEKAVLGRRLDAYYSASPIAYYQFAAKGGSDYSPAVLPFHCDLVARIKPGMKILELGCGSAHLCPHVEEAGGHYTGVDHGAELLKKNRILHPRARFLSVGVDPGEQFDLVASLYTIEHVVDPIAYLEEMWKLCKPGGLLAVICPDFVDGEGFAPSFFYGDTPRRLREKLMSGAFLDLLRHLSDLYWVAPLWKRRARASVPGSFWMNPRPAILHGASFSPDTDAVYLPRLSDLVSFLENRGASLLVTSRTMFGVSQQVTNHSCYVVSQLPGSLASDSAP